MDKDVIQLTPFVAENQTLPAYSVVTTHKHFLVVFIEITRGLHNEKFEKLLTHFPLFYSESYFCNSFDLVYFYIRRQMIVGSFITLKMLQEIFCGFRKGKTRETKRKKTKLNRDSRKVG